jgi:DNA-binding NarL/FixJ family response regulator
MSDPVHVRVVAPSAATALPLCLLLEEHAAEFAVQGLAGEEIERLRAQSAADLILLAPRRWDELPRWLPPLRREFPGAPWLVWADLCLAGMFLEPLSQRRCTVVAPHWSGRDLAFSLRALAAGHAPVPPAALRRLFSQAWSAATGRPVAITPRPFECGCALSHGLPPRRIADLLGIATATVRDHLNTLYRELDLHSQAAVGAAFRRTLTSLPPPF